MFVAFVGMIWFVAPIMWAKNVWYAQFMPISGAATYDNTGAYYNASAILTNNLFDEVKYQQYSPMFMPIVSALTWGCSFAVFGGLIVHTFRTSFPPIDMRDLSDMVSSLVPQRSCAPVPLVSAQRA